MSSLSGGGKRKPAPPNMEGFVSRDVKLGTGDAVLTIWGKDQADIDRQLRELRAPVSNNTFVPDTNNLQVDNE